MATNRPILIYGVGAMARTIHSYARRHRDVIGFTVDDALLEEPNARFCDLPLLPFSTIETGHPPDSCEILFAVGYRDVNALRLDRMQAAKARGYAIASYVDPSFIRHDGVTIGEGAVILDQVSIHADSCIGDGVFITSQVNLGHDVRLGDGCWINGGVSIAGGAQIGAQCIFGVNACVADGIVIGARAFIGANTLINRPVAPDSVILSPAGEAFRLPTEKFLKFSMRRSG